MRAGLLLALVVAGCARPPASEVVVFAASSLTDAYRALGAAFEAAHPGTRVVFAFAGSQTLRLQIDQGAPADVFASADATHLEGPRLTGHHTVARNALVIITPLANPAGVDGLADLPRARRVVLGTPEVPIGRYTAALLDRAAAALGPDFRARVEAAVASREANVRLVRAKVELGEADAAIVYRTDATPRVRVVSVPAAWQPTVALLEARLVDAPHPALADAWLAFTAAPAGQAILRAHGFDEAPPDAR
ncbi:MAG: molybdate ABC transporter substrate-binding protein [bacterium]